MVPKVKPVISKIFLHSGEDLNLGNSVIVKHPKIKDILAINDGFYCEELYWSYVSSILSDPYDNMVFLDDNGIDYEKSTPMEVLWLHWQNEDERSLIKNSLSFFLGDREYAMANTPYGKMIYAKNETYALGETQFDWATSFIFKINCLSNESRIKPATKSAKQILIEDMRDEIKRRAKRKNKEDTDISYIGDSITAIIYGSPSGVTPFNFEELSIYQLLCGAGSTHKQMRTQSMLNGIYTGMLKADKLPAEEFRWT